MNINKPFNNLYELMNNTINTLEQLKQDFAKGIGTSETITRTDDLDFDVDFNKPLC